MEARKMFEKLGYKQTIKKNHKGEIYCINYEKRRTGWGHAYSYYEFWLYAKKIVTGKYNDWHDLHHELTHKPKQITFEQLKAIEKQVSELGWNNESI